MKRKIEDDVAHVLSSQAEAVLLERDKAQAVADQTNDAIARTRHLIREVGHQPIAEQPLPIRAKAVPAPRLRSWEEIVAEARSFDSESDETVQLLSDEDAVRVRAKLEGWSAEFADMHRLRPHDLVVAGISGALAGIADIVLVQVPRHPGFLGGPAARGGLLSNAIKDKLSKLLPEQTVRSLEIEYPICYDACSNRNLNQPVAGFGPRTHRLQTLGHDPLLSWIFGVRDVLNNQCSAIGSDGKFTVQAAINSSNEDVVVSVFVRLLEAFRSVAGHLLSDVSTPAGLPPPLFALFQLIQTGSIKGRTISEIARIMYRSGYDFRHFLAGGLTTALIEVIVRTAWFVHELPAEGDIRKSLPVNQPRLTSTLFLAHSIAAGINAGKVMVSQNVLAVNYAQWLAFSSYLARQTVWVAYARESEREKHIQTRLDADWAQIDLDLQRMWCQTFPAADDSLV